MSFSEVMDGLLLGDGCLQKPAKTAKYTHSSKHEDYLLWVKNFLENEGVSFTPKIYRKDEGRGIYYQLHSRVHEMLTKEYHRWYNKDGKKIVPSDLRITPVSAKHWYIGDGGLDSDKGYLRQISFASHSFSYEERDFLVAQLKELGFKASNRKRGQICIAKSSVTDFIDWIGECPTESYKYKWELTKYQSKQPKYRKP